MMQAAQAPKTTRAEMQHVDDIKPVPSRKLSDEELTKLYIRYFPKVYGQVYYRVLSREQAEDIVSDIFVKIVRGYPRFDPARSSVSTWIFRITHNTLVDYYRSVARTASFDDAPVPEQSCEDEYRGLDDDKREVRRLLAYLGDEDRELVFLKYHEEKSNIEIGALLDINPSTVATRLSRALAKMRAHAGGGTHDR